jgi:hypothetical protein
VVTCANEGAWSQVLTLLCSVTTQIFCLGLLSERPGNETTRNAVARSWSVQGGTGFRHVAHAGGRHVLQEGTVGEIDDGVRSLERWLSHFVVMLAATREMVED